MDHYAARLSDEKYSRTREIDRTSKEYTRAKVPGDGGLKILDIGCGTGVNASHFAAMGHDVFGVDISRVAVEKFIEMGFQGCQCDVTQRIPVDDNQFDLVYASEIIEHVVDFEALLKEALRVLKPGGRLILSTINSTFWPFRLAALFGRTVSEIQHPGHVRFFSARSLGRAIESAGFEDVRVSARHMYLILAGSLFERLEKSLAVLKFKKEIRFKTMRPFWHWSRYAEKASGLWADTLIVTAVKPQTPSK